MPGIIYRPRVDPYSLGISVICISMKTEQWKPIKGFERYEVSSFGKVKNAKRNVVLKSWNSAGYEMLELWKDGERTRFLVHRLVAEAFIPNPLGIQVHHKNHVRDDNKMDNLEWSTATDNLVDMWIWGLKKLGYKITPPDNKSEGVML